MITSIELLLYKNISAQSNLSILKTFNIFSLFDYRSISEYNLVSVFSKPVRAEKAVWIIVLLVIFIISALILISANRNYPIKSPKKAFRGFVLKLNPIIRRKAITTKSPFPICIILNVSNLPA